MAFIKSRSRSFFIFLLLMSTFLKIQDLRISRCTHQNYKKNLLVKVSQVRFDLPQLNKIWKIRRLFRSFSLSFNFEQVLLNAEALPRGKSQRSEAERVLMPCLVAKLALQNQALQKHCKSSAEQSNSFVSTSFVRKHQLGFASTDRTFVLPHAKGNNACTTSFCLQKRRSYAIGYAKLRFSRSRSCKARYKSEAFVSAFLQATFNKVYASNGESWGGMQNQAVLLEQKYKQIKINYTSYLHTNTDVEWRYIKKFNSLCKSGAEQSSCKSFAFATALGNKALQKQSFCTALDAQSLDAIPVFIFKGTLIRKCNFVRAGMVMLNKAELCYPYVQKLRFCNPEGRVRRITKRNFVTPLRGLQSSCKSFAFASKASLCSALFSNALQEVDREIVKFDCSEIRFCSIYNSKARNVLTRKFSKKENKLHLFKKIKSIFSFDSHFIFALEQVNSKALTKQSIFSTSTASKFKYKNVQFKNSAFYKLNSNQKLTLLYSTNLDKMSFLSLDIANLGLSLNTYTFLKQKGIHKIGNLLEYSPKALLQLLNRNREISMEIKKCFLHLGVYGKTF